jgi:hypothetical protein
LEKVFEESGCLVFVAGEEVAVAVEGDGDAGVAHVGAEGFGVDAGGDHVGGVAVAAFVEGDRGEAFDSPCVFCSLVGGAGVEGPVAAVVGEDESVSAGALVEAVALEAVGVGEWDAAFAGAAFGFDVAGASVPASFDVDQVLVEVNVVPVECLEFAWTAPASVDTG